MKPSRSNNKGRNGVEEAKRKEGLMETKGD